MPSQQRHSYAALDALRGVAAALVVLGHARKLLFESAGLPGGGSGTLEKVLLLPTSFAVEAVAVFFVLSGYLVGGQVLRLHDEERFGWREFAARRGSRLVVVLLPGLVVTWLVDLVIEGTHPGFLAALADPGSSGPAAFACNAAFLQEARCDAFGSNASLWSLSYELWFYVLFAGAVRLVWRRGVSRTARAGAAVAVAAALLAFGPGLVTLMPAWLLGAAAAWYVRVRADGARWARPAGWLLLAAGLAGLALAQLHAPKPLTYPVIGLGVVPLVVAVVDRGPQWRPRWLLPAAWLGPWSYSLYVFHLPVVTLLAAFLADLAGRSVALDLALVAVVAVLSSAVAYLLSRLTERHTDAVRALLVPRRTSGRPAGQPGGQPVEEHRVIDLAGLERAQAAQAVRAAAPEPTHPEGAAVRPGQ